MARRLDRAVRGAELLRIETRLRKALAWLEAHPGFFDRARFERVESCGKHLLFRLDGGRWIHAHLLMFGSWRVLRPDAPVELDPNDRATLVTSRATLRFIRGQVLDIGAGDPYAELPTLARLGPDVLAEPFDADEFRTRLLDPERAEQEVPVALLDQALANGVGNYLKSEILFWAELDPWRTVGELSAEEVERLVAAVPAICRRAFKTGGWTVPAEISSRLRSSAAGPRTVGRRHWVFRRTGYPCHRCGTPIRQARQGPPRGRFTFWCPRCQDRTDPPRSRPGAAERAVAAEEFTGEAVAAG